jgi:large subunit ribosomal protein L30
MPAKLRVTLVKSPIGHTARTRGTLRALGLRRIGQTVEVTDNDQMRGLARTVRFLLRTEELAAVEQPATERRSRAKSPATPRQAGPAKSADTVPADAAPAEAAVAAPADNAPADNAPADTSPAARAETPPAKPRRAARTKKETDE